MSPMRLLPARSVCHFHYFRSLATKQGRFFHILLLPFILPPLLGWPLSGKFVVTLGEWLALGTDCVTLHCRSGEGTFRTADLAS